MGILSQKSKPKAVSVLSGAQQDLLDKGVIPFSTDLLGLFGGGGPLDITSLLKQFASGISPTTALSLEGLEQMALGGGDSAGTGKAANTAIQGILAKGPEDVEDFVQKSIFDPSMAEAERLIPFIQREGSASGNRFGDTTSRAIGELLADVNRTSTAARAAAALQAKQQQTQNQLIASQLGLGAGMQEVQQLVAQAAAGNMEAEIQLQNIASVLGIPAQLLGVIAQIAMQPTKGVGTQSPSVGAQQLAAALTGIGTKLTPEGSDIIKGAGACHAAAVYFGWFTPAWWAARSFILRGGLGTPFRTWYAAHSRYLAALLQSDQWAKARWRPIFTYAARRGLNG